MSVLRAIDTFVNVNMGSQERPDYLVRVAEDYFKRAPEIFQDISLEQMLETMDRCGVEKSVLSVRAENPSEEVLKLSRARPDRFVLAAYVDPRRGMLAVRALEKIVRNEPVVLARIVPFMIGLPPDDKCCYPDLRQVHRARPAHLGQHGNSRPARARQVPRSDLSRRSLPVLPRADADHGARRRPVVAGRDSADAEISQPLFDDVGLRAALFPGRAHPLHEHARTGQDHVRVRPPVLSMERCMAEAQELDLREGCSTSSCMQTQIACS